MNLWNESFSAIKNRTKTIEMRLPNDMLAYYSAEDIEKYGVLGIEVIVK